MVLAIISKTAINKNTRLYIIGCKIGCLFCKTLIFNVYCGADGTVVLGIAFLHEPVSAARIFFIVTLIGSVVGLKMS